MSLFAAFPLVLCALASPRAGAALPQEAPPLGGAHEPADERAFLEVDAERDSFLVGESIRLHVRFGVERDFLRDQLIQLFAQHLDVPVQLAAPWLEAPPGLTVLQESGDFAPSDDSVRLSFALDERVVDAVELEECVRGGRRFRVFELVRSFLCASPGEVSIPESVLRFAYATRFEEQFLGGRVPADRHEGRVYARGLTLHVQPLPEADRPPEFGGAVGRFSVRAEADPLELEVGESLKLALHIEGSGDLDAFSAPPLDGLDGFRVYGKIDARHGPRRSITYDLAPTSERVQRVPPIPFVFFDTTPPAGYRTVTTEAIPIVVRPRSQAAARETEAAPGSPAPATKVPGSGSGFRSWLLGAGSLAVILGLWMWRRGTRERAS